MARPRKLRLRRHRTLFSSVLVMALPSQAMVVWDKAGQRRALFNELRRLWW